MGEMAEFNEKFSSFSMTQLNELLEDDEKLNSIVKEMNEVSSIVWTKSFGKLLSLAYCASQRHSLRN